MRHLDLTKLLGGPALTTRIALSKNGLTYKLPALLDSGANGYCFIDHSLLKSLSFFLKPSIHPLPSPVPVKGFDGKAGRTISHYTTLNLTVDKRLQSFTPFLITHLGNHGVIIGRSWLEHHQVLLDAAKRRLIWPSEYPPTVSYSRLIEVRDLRVHKIHQRHQRDAERRDAKLREYWSRRDPQLPESTLTVNSPPLDLAPGINTLDLASLPSQPQSIKFTGKFMGRNRATTSPPNHRLCSDSMANSGRCAEPGSDTNAISPSAPFFTSETTTAVSSTLAIDPLEATIILSQN